MHQISYDPEGWTLTGREWRQVIEQHVGPGLHLIVVLVRRGERVSVREARIEHRYLTRREGWKRKTIKRLHVRDVRIEAVATATSQ